MKQIWTQDEAEFHGELVNFGPMWSWPKPTQSQLPVYIGGNVENSIKRAVDYGDGWMPVSDTAISFADSPLGDQIPTFRRLCTEAGRGHLPVTVFGSRQTTEDVEKYRSLGVDRLVFGLHVDQQPHTQVLAALDRVTTLVRSLA
jgi:alkanesulfonate monooxygenase SsuD/methylene tetrahydromethanopterin reductase-like flavin-dependent oxidoreductase (luciferase family)